MGLALSLVLHVFAVGGFLFMGSRQEAKQNHGPSYLVPVTAEPLRAVKAEELKKPEVQRERVKKIVKTPEKPVQPEPVDVEPRTNENRSETRDVRPVFGPDEKSMAEGADGGMAVRPGNTLMTAQEEKPADSLRIKPLQRAVAVIPVFELTTLPAFRRRVQPEYPESLKKEEREGEVVLSARIDDNGTVIDVTVIRSTHALFTQAAVAALKKSRFTPATRNGSTVATVLDDLVYSFVLDR